jgi:hypothetical protein
MTDKPPWQLDWGAPATSRAAPGAPAAAGAASVINPWEANWEATPSATPVAPHGDAADVGLSAAAGLRSGGLMIPSMPGDIVDLAGRGIQKLIDLAAPESHLSTLSPHGAPQAPVDAPLPAQIPESMRHNVPPYLRTQVPANPSFLDAWRAVNPFPTYDKVSDVATKVGVPDYEPKTDVGRYAKTITSFAPLALTGGEGMAMNLLKGAVAPGIGSQFLGDRFAGTWLETPARMLGALGAGQVSQLAHAGAAKAATLGAQGSTAAQIGDLIGAPVTRGAVARVGQDVRNDAVTPASAAARMADLGPEGMMLDAGRQLQGRAEAIATQPGAGQNTVLNAVEGRTGNFGDATAARIKDTLDTHMGAAPDVVDLTNRVSNIVDAHAKPLYDHLMAAHPVINVPGDITSRPAVAAAMKNATTLAEQYGEKLTSPPQTNTILQGPGYHIADDVTPAAQTSLRYWDYVKKDMDRRINSYMKSGGTSELNSADKADLGGLINARNALRDNLDAQTGGAYAQARKVAAQKPQLLEALENGRSALGTKLLPEEMTDVYNNLSMPEQTMYRAGVRREIDRVIDTARNDGAAARRILDTNQNREKIAAMFGNDAAQAIDNRIAAETHFQNTTNNIARNSRTAVRQQLQKDTESPSVAAPPQANIMGYAHKAITGALEGMRNTGMENTRAAIGSMMTTPAHQVPDLVRLLANYGARAARLGQPGLTPSMSSLGRLIANSAMSRQGSGSQPGQAQ